MKEKLLKIKNTAKSDKTVKRRENICHLPENCLKPSNGS